MLLATKTSQLWLRPGARNLTIEDGLLTGLYLSENLLTSAPVPLGLLFVALGPVAFAVLAADFLWRLWGAWDAGGRAWSVAVFLQALLWFGSDGMDGPGEWIAVKLSNWSAVNLLISLCLVNLLSTPALLVLRASKGGPVQALTWLACVALFLKFLIGFYIHQTTFDQQPAPPAKDKQPQPQPQPQKQQQQHQAQPDSNHHASSRVSFDVAYGDTSPGPGPGPADNPQEAV